MTFRPGFLGRRETSAVTEQEFRETVPGTQQVGADVFATAEEITSRFFLLGGNVNRGEGGGAMEDGELAGIASVGFDAIARPPGNQRRRDDLTRYLVRGQRSLQLEATRTGFVTAGHRPLPLQAIDEAKDRRVVRGECV